ncbi:FHA domain-containing protein [Verrucomicrobiales bacterium]|nr:FHA domain-containing protein [bacterium]MDB4808892.1 FHA domain-containing protein [Verrucomicrobiales bacterium]
MRDVGSSNGTKVSGQRVFGDVRLQDGDTVAFGMIEATLAASPAKVQKLKPKPKRVNGDGQVPKRIPLKKAESSTLQDTISKHDKEIESSKQLVSAAVRTQYRRLLSEQGSVALRKTFVTSCCVCNCDTRLYQGQS